MTVLRTRTLLASCGRAPTIRLSTVSIGPSLFSSLDHQIFILSFVAWVYSLSLFLSLSFHLLPLYTSIQYIRKRLRPTRPILLLHHRRASYLPSFWHGQASSPGCQNRGYNRVHIARGGCTVGKVPREDDPGGARDLCEVGEACNFSVWEWVD